jgi:hypothetical protein
MLFRVCGVIFLTTALGKGEFSLLPHWIGRRIFSIRNLDIVVRGEKERKKERKKKKRKKKKEIRFAPGIESPSSRSWPVSDYIG